VRRSSHETTSSASPATPSGSAGWKSLIAGYISIAWTRGWPPTEAPGDKGSPDQYPKLAAQPDIAPAFLVGVLVWFALDTAVSLATGAMINVVGSIAFLVLLLPPLAALARSHV
jgi:hypothetical protein